MSVRNITNHAASVYAKLKNIAHDRHLEFTRLLTRYSIERFLYRLGESPYARQFVLKGGNLFIIWQNGDTSRTTMDSDFLFFGDASEEHLRKIFTDIAASDVCSEDGMQDLHEIITRLADFLLPVLHTKTLQTESWNRHTGEWMNDVEMHSRL